MRTPTGETPTGRLPILNITSATVDRIVADVLAQLSSTEVPPTGGSSDNARRATEVAPKAFDLDLSHTRVLTGEMLEALNSGASVRVSKSVVLTPSAREVVKNSGLQLADAATAAVGECDSKSADQPQLLVVTSTPEIRTLADTLKKAGWHVDFLGCDSEAIKAAKSAVCRGESNFVAIIAPKANRTAQRLNRTRNVLAAAVLPEINVNELIAEGEWNVACLSAERWASFRLRKTLEQFVGQASPDAAVQRSSIRKGGL